MVYNWGGGRSSSSSAASSTTTFALKLRMCGSRRPISALLLAFILAAALCMLYLSYEVVRLPLDKNTVFIHKKLTLLEGRLRNLETAATRKQRGKNGIESLKGIIVPSLQRNRSSFSYSNRSAFECLSSRTSVAKADIQMHDVYDQVDYGNTDGGVWKQGFPLEYNDTRWDSNNVLRVFVVPHSHNDPGWLKTFEKYYLDQTQHILNNMVNKLGEDKRRKMIWAEISFLSLWWERSSESERSTMRKFLDDGQLEVVTGGWVMNDEAVTHYFAMIEQLIEGHEWLQNHIGYYPKNGWAIDPFGLSPTMAYLLKRMGLSHMVIQRVHYSVKKHLAARKSIEFFWRQVWDGDNNTDIFCQVMPFYSYDIPHTCGPDPKVCCQFDFKRLPGGKINCPWKVPPQPITSENVAEKSWLLLDQYRKKSLLFRTNVLFVPLGDDFRYDKAIEWDQQYSNYQRLFDYMNGRSEWNVKAQFGTLDDYFAAVEEDVSTSKGTKKIPSLVGDFFSYADRDDHYWSGFYSSRPFYKNMDRIVEAYLRAGEIAFSTLLTHAVTRGHILNLDNSLKSLVEARRNMGLFQHHDGITGTSKDPVVIDYANKLLRSETSLQAIIGQSASVLLSDRIKSDLSFDLDDTKSSHKSLSMKTLIVIPSSGSRTVVFYNSLARKRDELVTLLVNSNCPCVLDSSNSIVLVQVNPVWQGRTIIEDRFYAVFVVSVPALGFASYKLFSDSNSNYQTYPKVVVYSSDTLPGENSILPWTIVRGGTGDFNLNNSNVMVTFSDVGILKSITTLHDNYSLDVTISLLQYGTRNQKDKSGAYLFLPGGEPTAIPFQDSYFRVTHGQLLSEVEMFLPHIDHKVLLKSSPGVDGLGVEVENVVDIGKVKNREIVMRVETSVQNEDEFFTDLNGFQMVRRRNRDNLPLQANFYPVSLMAYIQDESTRFTVIMAQPLGGACLQNGWFEMILDRRLNQDDNRGLQQGVMDNVPTLSQFRFLVEKRLVVSEPTQSFPSKPSFPSLVAHFSSQSLLYPIVRLIVTSNDPMVLPSFSLLKQDFPCDVHLVTLRTLISESETFVVSTKNASLLLLHRIGFDCQFYSPSLDCSLSAGKVILGQTFGNNFRDEVVQTSLSALYDIKRFSKSDVVELQSMEIYAFKLFR